MEEIDFGNDGLDYCVFEMRIHDALVVGAGNSRARAAGNSRAHSVDATAVKFRY